MTHSFANVLYLSICMLGIVHMLTFFKIKFLQINHPGPSSECQTVWIQIKTGSLLVFIWVQTVCKRLLADDENRRWHAKSYNKYNILSHIGSFQLGYTCICIPNYSNNLKTYAAISNAHLFRVCKRGKLSGSCLSTLNGFGSTQLPIFLCHISVPTFSSQNNY